MGASAITDSLVRQAAGLPLLLLSVCLNQPPHAIYTLAPARSCHLSAALPFLTPCPVAQPPQEDIATLETQLSQEKADHAFTVDRKADLQKSHDALSANLEAHKAKLADTAAKLAAAQAEVEALKKTLDDKHKEITTSRVRGPRSLQRWLPPHNTRVGATACALRARSSVAGGSHMSCLFFRQFLHGQQPRLRPRIRHSSLAWRCLCR